MQVVRNKIIIAAVAAAVILGLGLFFSGVSDAPKKTMSEIAKAVKNSDADTFEKYVDLQSFYSEGFDSMMSASMKWSWPRVNSTADVGFISMFKAAIVQELVMLSRQVLAKGGTADFSNVGKLEDSVEMLGVTAWELKRVGSSKKRGETAVVPLTIRDRQVEKDFVFDLELHKTGDGVWRVKKIANAEALILARMAAAKEKLDKINAGIRKEMANAVAISNEKSSLQADGGGYFASRYAQTSFSAKNKQNKEIVSFNASLTIYAKNGELLYTNPSMWSAFSSNVKFVAGEQKELSARAYVDREAYEELSKKENQGGKIKIAPSYVKFDDGVELSLLSKLPPYGKK